MTTPLYSASEKGHIEAMKLLIEHGANIYAEDKYAHTAMWIALEMNHVDAVALLIDSGFDVNKKDRHGQSLLYIATYHSRVRMMHMLVHKGAEESGYKLVGAACAARSNGDGGIALITLRFHGVPTYGV